MFAGSEPATSCFELRGLTKRGSVACREFIRVCGVRRVIRRIEDLSPTLDVLVSCAPRVSYTSGTLDDIERSYCLWADCDSSESADKLRAFRPLPTLVATASR
jgi:hypothetical protein